MLVIAKEFSESIDATLENFNTLCSCMLPAPNNLRKYTRILMQFKQKLCSVQLDIETVVENTFKLRMVDLVNIEQKISKLSQITNDLLNAEIPSNLLNCDPTYGKQIALKKISYDNRIPLGTKPEEYLKILESQLNKRGEIQRTSSKLHPSFHK
jgi:hypothetical protein